eukprot:CAMPEP_0204274258 /NCGR_PEP_ID=MMETSP0468-20130131/25091_1 /ASSEMBLY_ACC=CAM_ASM_000383 /TAXON_ID=2969 /ORGANISM="Oxyrrhis marina" /LENGTH=104 /DNA_ID=CAMNT_0051250449 /DNA_START=432 /DNA_END=747 /DNA_ORIENTATION=+
MKQHDTASPTKLVAISPAALVPDDVVAFSDGDSVPPPAISSATDVVDTVVEVTVVDEEATAAVVDSLPSPGVVSAAGVVVAFAASPQVAWQPAPPSSRQATIKS